MTLVVRSVNENIISLPGQLMAMLNLHDGEEIRTVIDGTTLHLVSLAQFLQLRGALQDDDAFDEAMDDLERAWQSWTIPESV
jgi:antitoxin component of MazEF toxin-antitoxin module